MRICILAGPQSSSLQDVRVEQGYLRVRHGKGDKTRAVSLPPEVDIALFHYRRHHRPATADPHFFVTRSGTPLTANGIACVVRRAWGKRGIARLHTYLLRHAFGVAALRGGMDRMALKETPGHEAIHTTTNYLVTSEAPHLGQQRKVNPIAGFTFPQAVCRANLSAKCIGVIGTRASSRDRTRTGWWWRRMRRGTGSSAGRR